MHLVCTFVFWAALLFVVYTYALYPLLIALLARAQPWPVGRLAGHQSTVTVLIAVHNEGANLVGRIHNLLCQDYPAENFEIVIVDDGSTDNSRELVLELGRQHKGRIKAVLLKTNEGKAQALNAGMEVAIGDLIVLCDARQRFESGALARLVENFAEPEIGSVSGELMFTSGDPEDAAATGLAASREEGPAADVGAYWKYEKWMRRNESTFDSMLGATGAIYAIRRCLFRPLPSGTLLDDFLIPMRIVMNGHRAIFDGRARAWDRPSARGAQEFRRKVRTLAGNYQAFSFEPGLLSPKRNRATWWQVWSHKLFRLWVPFALLLMLLSCFVLALGPGFFGKIIFAVQFIFYGFACWGWRRECAGQTQPHKFVSLAYTFGTLNLAAAAGLWVWLQGCDHRGVWRKAYADSGG